jgi:multiple sugar transport system permease protein
VSADTAIRARAGRAGSAVGIGARHMARLGARGWAGLFLMPALLLILFVSIFPLVASLYMAFTKLTMTPGGFELKEVGWLNFRKLITGSQQGRFLGKIGEVPVDVVLVGLLLFAGLAALLLRPVAQLPARRVRAGAPRLLAALIGAALLSLLYLNLRLDGFGAVGTTLIFVIFGVGLQFALGLALAAICYERLRGVRVFRAIFFIPFMITPVGIAYMTRMIADTQRGPVSGLWSLFGLGEFSWATDPLAARIAVIMGDTWQWVPFMFILLTAALESLPTETREAAQIDGANRWQTFRYVTLPQLAPVAITLILIRMIEAFKIIDLPNVLTAGGPGTATESLALYGYITWRALDLGGSAAISYLMLILVTLATLGLILGTRPVRQTR